MIGHRKGLLMKMGVISDSHEDPKGMLPKVINHLIEKEGVKIFLHAGDIFLEHINAGLFQGLPVICALTDDDYERFKAGEHRDENKRLAAPASNWTFTHPQRSDEENEYAGRIVDMRDVFGMKFRIYLGHKRWEDYLYGPESEFIKTLEIIRRDYDNLRYFIAGHHHRQFFNKTSHNITCINPGAIQDSAGVFGGYEYAVIDTKTDLVIFDRIPSRESKKEPLTLGIISDTLDISEHYSDYWENMAEIFNTFNVSDIIHCGNLNQIDVGHSAFENFQVHYNSNRHTEVNRSAWHCSKSKEDGVPIRINGYSFLIRLNLGAEMWDQSGFDMHRITLKVKTEYPDTRVILCGSSRQSLYIEDEQMIFVNPGCAFDDQSYTIIELPRGRLTFGRIPIG